MNGGMLEENLEAAIPFKLIMLTSSILTSG